MSDIILRERAIIRVTPKLDAPEGISKDFLQGLITQDVYILSPEKPLLWSALLTPQGKLLFDFFLWYDGPSILIDCEACQAKSLLTRLKLYRLNKPVDIAMAKDMHVLWVHPDDGGDNKANVREYLNQFLEKGVSNVPKASNEPHSIPHLSQAASQNVSLMLSHGPGQDPRLNDLGWRALSRGTIAASDEGKNIIAGEGVDKEGGRADTQWRTHRLSCGVAEGVEELGSGKILWLECNAAELNGVSFEKGCYIGQENTIRMHHRGKVNRRIVVVPDDEADPARRLAHYGEIGFGIEHRRLDQLAGLSHLPHWLLPVVEGPVSDQ